MYAMTIAIDLMQSLVKSLTSPFLFFPLYFSIGNWCFKRLRPKLVRILLIISDGKTAMPA